MYKTVEFNIYAENLNELIFGDLELQNNSQTDWNNKENAPKSTAGPIPMPDQASLKDLEYPKNRKSR